MEYQEFKETMDTLERNFIKAFDQLEFNQTWDKITEFKKAHPEHYERYLLSENKQKNSYGICDRLIQNWEKSA